MRLTHTFTVPVDRATAWATFEDVSSVAECFPGAVVTSAEDDTFQGTCKVKLGPVALQYAGSGTFLERDEAAGRLVLDAKGRDKRGNGTAGAHVTATFAEESSSATRVQVVTELQITGKPAQFGRGMIQDVSDKLLAEFVECLRSKVALPDQPASPVEPASHAEPTTGPGSTGTAAASVAAATPATPRREALDLGATLLPVLVKSYGKQLGAVLLALLAVVRLIRLVRRLRA